MVGFDDLDKNMEALNEGLVEYLVTRHIPMQSYYTISNLASAVISGKVPEKRDNLMHMDILHRLNSKHYSIFKDRHLELVYLRYSTGAPEDYIHLIPDNLYPFRLIPERKKFLTEHLFFGLKVVNMQFAVERRIAGGKIDLTVLDETALADADLIVGHLEKDILQFRANWSKEQGSGLCKIISSYLFYLSFSQNFRK